MSSKGIPQNADLTLIVVMALKQSGGEASNEAIREFEVLLGRPFLAFSN
jgi:hypothetical protein